MNSEITWDVREVRVQVPATSMREAANHHFSHEELAAKTDYDALALGLPRTMEATLVLRIEGRIDGPEFCIIPSFEPFHHAHPWLAYRRVGALLFVGERMMRLNLQQMRVLDALDVMNAAGPDVAARLRAWSQLHDALHITGRHQVLVENDLPYLRIYLVNHLPPQSKTRIGKQIVSVADHPQTPWSMEAGRRYYLRINTSAAL